MRRLVALAIAAVPALAQEKVALKTKHVEGDAVDVRIWTKMQMSSTIGGQAMSMKRESVEEYREKTLATKEGRPVRAERCYTKYEETGEQKQGSRAAQGATTKNAIVGRTIVLVKQEDGKVAPEAKPEVGDLAEEDLDFATDDLDVLLPDVPVAVGEEWKVPQDKLAAAFGGGVAPTDATCRLEEIAERDRAKVARIAVKVTLKGEENGMKLSGELAGPFLFDLTTSRPLSGTFKGTMKVDTGTATLEGPMEAETTFTSVR